MGKRLGRPKTINWTKELLEAGIREVMFKEKIDKMPTQKQVQAHSHSLASGIQYYGGYLKIARDCGIGPGYLFCELETDKVDTRVKSIKVYDHYIEIESSCLSRNKQEFDERYPFMKYGVKIEPKY